MIRRAWALCVLIALVVAGGAQAHDSGPAIARAIVALHQGPISFDPAAAVSEQQADAVNQRLGRSTGISVAILPVDPQFSAVGAARELEFHLNRPGTIITLLGTRRGGDEHGRRRTRARHARAREPAVYDREGTVPALTGLIDAIEACATLPATGNEGGRLAVGARGRAAALAAASALALFGLRRARRP